MNRLSTDKRAAVVAALVEGNSIRSTVRMTGVAKNTVTKLLTDLGLVCSIHQDAAMRDLYCERIQCDEIWSFVGAKAKNVKPERRADGWGDVWTWVAMDPGSKLVISYRVGTRGPNDAHAFMIDLASRLRYRVQLTTDGYQPYLRAVRNAFENEIDYAVLVKIYGTDQDSRKPGAALLARRLHRGDPATADRGPRPRPDLYEHDAGVTTADASAADGALGFVQEPDHLRDCPSGGR